jgi:hypothetical protein
MGQRQLSTTVSSWNQIESRHGKDSFRHCADSLLPKYWTPVAEQFAVRVFTSANAMDFNGKSLAPQLLYLVPWLNRSFS